MPKRTEIPRAELHTHLGSSVDPALLWSIAHRQGIKLPSKNYWDFEDMITMGATKKNKSLDDMHFNFYHWTELIQSSPEAIEESVKSVFGGGYRKCNIVLQELHFNPMFRNRGGERDLDHIIMAAVWGLERALLEYPQVKGGLVLMMDRMLTFQQNKIIAQKAIKYKNDIVGLDVGGPQRKTFSMKRIAPLFQEAKKVGLGLTIHTGEEGSLDELRYVVTKIKPQRIGHGIICVKDGKIMKEIVKNNIVLEFCPTANLKNSVIKNISELKSIVRTFLKNKIKFTINTDGPEMYRTNIHKEQEFLRQNKILTGREIAQCAKWAFEASFIKN